MDRSDTYWPAEGVREGKKGRISSSDAKGNEGRGGQTENERLEVRAGSLEGEDESKSVL